MSKIEALKEIELKGVLDKEKFLSLLDSKKISIEQDLLRDGELFESTKNYFILNYFPEFVESPKKELNVFYCKYYWLSALIYRYKELFGSDTGLEQQLFKLCEETENSSLDVDWSLVESIENSVNKAK